MFCIWYAIHCDTPIDICLIFQEFFISCRLVRCIPIHGVTEFLESNLRIIILYVLDNDFG